MQNSTSDPYVAPVFSPPSYAVAVNALFFASLGVVLIAAFLCMLVKGWIRELDRKLRGIPDLQKRAVIKELREQGLARWWFPEIITILPSLIHLSLVLFFVGLALYLLQVHILPAYLSISIFGFGVAVYIVSIFISAIDEFSPFRSMYSRALGVLYRRLYSRFLSRLVLHFSSLRVLPQNAFEKLHEQVSTFIKSHEPRSEQDILDPPSSSSKQIISQTSAPVLNRLLGSIGSKDTSTYAKDISISILLQLEDLNIRPPLGWGLPWLYENSNISIQEAKCLVYNTCMQGQIPDSPRFWEIIHASIELVDRSSDPWLHLVILLIRTRVGDQNWDFLKSSIVGQGVFLPFALLPGSNVAAREAELLQAISDVGLFSEEQWNFILSAIYTLFIRQLPREIPAIARILVKLLQNGVIFTDDTHILPNKNIDFWVHAMLSLFGISACVPSMGGGVLHARDVEVCGTCKLRDTNYISQALWSSRHHDLDPSVMRGCLVAIIYILILNNPTNRQEIRLVNQYLDIIEKEMDVITWSTSLSEVFTNSDYRWYNCGYDPEMQLSRAVSCLLRGRYSMVYGRHPEEVVSMMYEYDLKLSAVGAQPTTSILSVMDWVSKDQPLISEVELQNSWLSLYAHNVTRSSYTSAIPAIWSSDCTPIASRRLDLYDRGRVTPEIDLVILFLSSDSASIACRALQWYLHLHENLLPPNDTRHFIAFPAIFRKSLPVDQNREGWVLLMNTLLPMWDSMSLKEQLHFAETFFGCEIPQGSDHTVATQHTIPAGEEYEKALDSPDVVVPESAPEADGLGWMEDVWKTVLQSHIVHIVHVDAPWLELSESVQVTYPDSTHPTQLPSISPSGAPHEGSEAAMPSNQAKIGPKTMNDLAREFLSVLAQLLEAGADSMPDTLLKRVRESPLISDGRLKHDVGSLCRIQRVINRNLER